MLIITFASPQLLALLLLRHALYLTNGDGEDDAYTFFSVDRQKKNFPFNTIMLVYWLLLTFMYVNSFYCCELPGFFFPATSWHGPSAYYNVEDNDRCVLKSWFNASHLRNSSYLLVFVLPIFLKNLNLLLFGLFYFLTGSCISCSDWSCIYAASSTRSEPSVYSCSRACSYSSSRATPIMMLLYGVQRGIIHINFNLYVFDCISPFSFP